MEAHIHMWLALLLRWAHFITGVAWIGASFYFNWLENHLERTQKPEGVAGDLWAVHGGGFYYLKKFKVAPDELPATLHWFKWEAYTTWLSGFALLCVTYYLNARVFLLQAGGTVITEPLAITAGLSSMLVSWVFYDLLCRSRIAASHFWFAAMLLGWFVILAWGLGQIFSGRAAYIHVGAAIGTIMVANVFRVIIPSQKELVSAVTENRVPQASKGIEALQRSRHNNYFTLPVLFIMISSHYPATYGHDMNWLVLLLISLSGLLVRHYFNLRHLPSLKAWPLAVAAILFVGLVAITAPKTRSSVSVSVPEVGIMEAWEVVQQRCMTCHAEKPGNTGFTSAPLGIELDTIDGLRRNAEKVYMASVINMTMPLGNLTQMTDAERYTIANWFENRVQGQDEAHE
ncbi:MAG: putative membrane protein [Lysobacterales bacterium]|jgi:uncharacterized membrane protein